jgi:hypothetical protein
MSHTALLLCLFGGFSADFAPAPGGADKDAQVASEKKAIRNHAWWAKRPLSEKVFESLIKEITEHKGGMVFVNNEAKFVWVKSVKGDPRGGARAIHAAAEQQYPKVRALGLKRIVIVVAPRQKQKNARMVAIFRLVDALDAGGYDQFAPKKGDKSKTKKPGPKK